MKVTADQLMDVVWTALDKAAEELGDGWRFEMKYFGDRAEDAMITMGDIRDSLGIWLNSQDMGEMLGDDRLPSADLKVDYD